jgi:hypothetical protein
MGPCSTPSIRPFPPGTESCGYPSPPGLPSERATRRRSERSNRSLLLVSRFVNSHVLNGPSIFTFVIWSSLSANTCVLHPNTPVGFGIGLTQISSRPTHLHAFGEAFVVDARTPQMSASIYLQSAFVRLDRFEWRDKRAQLTGEQWQMIKTLIPKVLSSAAQSASRQLLDAR